MSVKELNISPVGRVEGDLDVKVYIDNGKVTRAHTQAAMFRLATFFWSLGQIWRTYLISTIVTTMHSTLILLDRGLLCTSHCRVASCTR